MDSNQLQSGDTVFVIQRNPHTQSVAHIQEASIVTNPFHPGHLALFFMEEYYPLTDDLAIYTSYSEAKGEYTSTFGPMETDSDDQSAIQEVYD